MADFQKILKANPHHDSQGRFSSASGAGKSGKPYGQGGSGSDADKAGSGGDGKPVPTSMAELSKMAKAVNGRQKAVKLIPEKDGRIAIQVRHNSSSEAREQLRMWNYDADKGDGIRTKYGVTLRQLPTVSESLGYTGVNTYTAHFVAESTPGG